ncbi:unnamed protein product [marine sediment metagenome]|uniref:F5/8 type C domain-containing protein n=1 Tax=marine sediment metagenome TaxID=412755 RepID=X1LIK0_9ZZZZ
MQFYGDFADLTETLFRAGTLTGDLSGIANLVDNETATIATALAVNKYAHMDLGEIHRFKQFRHYGNTGNAGDGVWQLEIERPEGWVKWGSPFNTNPVEDWGSGWIVVSTVYARRIRLICLALDTSGGTSKINELEVKY